MPGKVVRVHVEAGAAVEKGAGVIVVEAMKMQNEMKSPRAGVVVSVNVKPGDTVNAGDVLAVVGVAECGFYLWDIDGTLMRSARNGSYKDYTIPVLEEIFGTSGRLSDMRVSGMTDLQIVFEALAETEVSQDQIRAQIDRLCLAAD